ncbi:sn-glycerol-1-phosphate dehydrogenase [Acuticoccus sp. M5D2P5]|uniref:sn-glycerol-1-phosphate dehydrogenase n=1 Tax=Acuticoccus kalidii TaxID=2910977 RepID=UPI001F3558EB|nr:sn-glycerol-1-phosphate dehydrogenase [Acuticoccus kalidii]MCF3932427.1 sn-glycerol-1-phosphate dehydrogenase [Acuticoccus kalidii]
MANVNDILGPAVERSDAIAEIAVGNAILADAPAVLRRHFGDGPAMVVADENTFAAAGKAVVERLEAAGVDVATHILPARPRPKPTVELGRSIADALGDRTPISVGSGVLNDVTKYAAHSRDRAYLCIATAASMDGYSSAGAPLSDQGFKKTIPCRAPHAILADLDVIARAPAEMSGWGYGDLAGKVPAGGDWLIADALGIEPIDDVAWPLVQDNLAGWLSAPGAVKAGEPKALADLFVGLTLSGLAMEFHGTSRPASGADHQIAHMWEMEGLTLDGERVSHGACVSIGTLAALRLFDWLLDKDLTALPIDDVVAAAASIDTKRAEIASLMDGTLAERAIVETEAKHADPETHRARLHTLKETWPTLKERLASHLKRTAEMERLLREAGAPTTPREIGINPEHLRTTVHAARFIRSRYTILDLIEECGLFEAAISEALAAPAYVA